MVKNHLNGLLLAVIFINSCTLVGCHRSYYRRQADVEARRLILEKAVDPRWNTADGSIEIDPQSRMFNPFSQDHPPIPPDDAASHQFMHRVDGKDGYPHWHANGDTNYVESPVWMSYLPTNEKGQLVLNLDRAYKLALIHSPELQRQRESLYQSALDVSLERFGFDSQMFTGFNSFLTTQGRLRGGAGTSSTTLQSQLGSNGGGLDIRRAGITGANFAVGLANTILFNFAGNNTQSATSLIDFSVIQPLLRGAGRERILESLTQAERTLLANVRQMERFRRGFYLQIATGRNPGSNVGGNLLGTPGSANANAGGFFGLLEDQQRIRNQEFNVRQLEAVLEQFREFFSRDRLDAVQLKLFESTVYRQQRTLLDLKTNYQTSLDQFKLTLGLPPDVELVIDDEFLDRFKLIGDQINERLISIGKLRRDTGLGLNGVYSVFKGVDKRGFWEDFEWPDDLVERIEKLNKYLVAAEETLEKITGDDRDQLEEDFKKLDSVLESRAEYLERVKKAIASGRIISNVSSDLFEPDSIQDPDKLRKAVVDPDMDNREFVIDANGKKNPPPRSILKRAEILKKDLAEVKKSIANFAEAQATKSRDPKVIGGTEYDPELYQYIVSEFQRRIPGQLYELNNLALEMSLLQARARSNSIEINDVDIMDEHAIRIAKCMRRDWMNARAGLVDQYRNIEFVADQLEAGVDLVFEGDIGNTGDNPFKLRYETGQLRAGFRFDSPLVRMSERNAYRNALIAYQQSKRSMYQFEDNVKRNIRNIIRSLDRLKVVFELDKLSVQVTIENVEINRYELDRPVAPGNNSRLGTQTARNLSDSIRDLNNTQNQFLGSWVQFEVLRRSLDYDMGTMQLDQNGVWLDPGQIDDGIATRAANMMGIQLDCQFCENVEMSYTDDSQAVNPVYGEPTPVNSLEFESDSYDNTPLGSPNDPSVLETDSRPTDLDGPIIDDSTIEGVIDPTGPTEDFGTSSLQRSNLIPRNLFQPVRSSASRKKKSPTKNSVASRESKPKSVVAKQFVESTASNLTESQLDPSDQIVTAIEPTPLFVDGFGETTSANPIAAATQTKPDQPAEIQEPAIDLASSQEPQSLAASDQSSGMDLTVAWNEQNESNELELALLDDALLNDTLEQASFWAFLEQDDSNNTLFNGLIESSMAITPSEQVAPAAFEDVVENAEPKPESKMSRLESQIPMLNASRLESKALKPNRGSDQGPATAKNTNSIPVVIRKPSMQPKVKPEDWQKQQTSLGGVLNRFRTK